jgi:hypothetical protein
MVYFLKFFTSILLIILIIFFLSKPLFFFKKSKEICFNFLDFCSKKVPIAKLTKYSFIAFSILKLSVSLYVIALLFTTNSLYAFALMIVFLFSICLILYKIWLFSKRKQEKILFFTGQFVFLSIILLFFAIFGIFFLNSFLNLRGADLWSIFLAVFENLQFNLVFAFFSLILFKIFFDIADVSLGNIKKNDLVRFNFFLKIFDFIGFFPKILYGLNCFFLNQILNPGKNFFILAFICGFNSGIFFSIQAIRRKFLNDDSLNFYIIENHFVPEKNFDLNFSKKNFISFQKIFSYFWLFLNEMTILIPVFFLSKDLRFTDFYSNFLIRIFEIFQNSDAALNSRNQNYILFSGLLFFGFYFIYLFSRKDFLQKFLKK